MSVVDFVGLHWQTRIAINGYFDCCLKTLFMLLSRLHLFIFGRVVMAKFNQVQTIKTVNKEGHVAYGMNDKSKLVTQVLTSFFNESKLYGDNSEEMLETIKRVIAVDPAFVAKLAVFARREFNMRSVAHVLVAHLAHEEKGKAYAKAAVKGVCLRGDDATEILACYISMFGKPIPNSLRRGLKEVVEGFDEYTLAKYKGGRKSVKMKDLICLCRPKPKNGEQAAAWKKLIEGTMEPPMTWEVELSRCGNNKETWERLIASGKVGYMALLRNLRNILAAKPDNLDVALKTLSDPEAVRKSRQLPFRFLSAYKEVWETADSKVIDALEDAIEASIENMPKLSGTTVIAADTSGSMGWPVSSGSRVACYEIGMLLGVMASKMCESSIFYTFSDDIRKEPVSKRTPILATVSNVSCEGGTWMHLPFKKMIEDGVKADRVIIISDNQCNCFLNLSAVQSYVDKYNKLAGDDIWVHAIDLQGYGTQQFHGEKTNIIAGWSEKVLDFIKLAEQGAGTLEKAIEQYTY